MNVAKKLLKAMLDKPTPGKAKTSFSLNAENYQKFRELCRKRGIHPSQLIDLMIADILSEFEK